jgi:hypothetical protein
MIDFESIKIQSFIDELQKIANIEVDSEGRMIYHSNDQDKPKKKQDDARLGYESYTEDSASGTPTLQTQPSPN